MKEIKSKVNSVAAYAFMAFGHFYLNKTEEAEQSIEKMRKELDELKELLDKQPE